MKKNILKIEKDKIDHYIITACITFIASFILILSINKPKNIFNSFLYLFSLLSLMMSLLFSLCHKFRYSKRTLIFEQKSEKIISNTSIEIADFIEKLVIPAATRERLILTDKTQNLLNNKPKEVPIEEAVGDHEKITRNIVKTYLETLTYKFEELYNASYNKPLNEKYGKLLLYVDILCRNTRYAFFVVGITFYFVSFVFSLMY